LFPGGGGFPNCGKNCPGPNKPFAFATAAAAAAAAAAANWKGLLLFPEEFCFPGLIEEEGVVMEPGEEDDEETQGFPSRTNTGTATLRGGGGRGIISFWRWLWSKAIAAATWG